MNCQNLRRWLGLVVLVISLLPLSWGYWPTQISHRRISLRPSDFQPPEGTGSVGGLTFDLPRLELTWPERLRRGDVGGLRLLISYPLPQSASSLPASGFPAGGDYNLLVEARLEVSSLVAAPLGSVAEPLLAGHPAIFFWNVRGDLSGDHPGMLWINLRFIPLGLPDADQLQDVSRVLTAQRISIRTEDLYGLNGPQARALGGMGAVVGVFLALGDIIFRLLAGVFLNARADSAHRHNLSSLR